MRLSTKHPNMKVIYGLQIEQAIEQAPMEVGEDKLEQVVVEILKDESIRERHEESIMKEVDIEAIAKEEQQQDQNIPEVHMLSVSLPHVDKVDEK